MACTRRRRFGNIAGHVKAVSDISSLATLTVEQFDCGLDWNDAAWIKRRWGGKLVMKGILVPDDARRALDCGADAIVVSNHDGRPLDGAPSSISALPEIAARVGNATEVWLDGGIRSGQDVFKALALCARAVLIGCAFVHGLGAFGKAGMTLALKLIRRELDLTMVLCGVRSIAGIDRRVLHACDAPPAGRRWAMQDLETGGCIAMNAKVTARSCPLWSKA